MVRSGAPAVAAATTGLSGPAGTGQGRRGGSSGGRDPRTGGHAPEGGETLGVQPPPARAQLKPGENGCAGAEASLPPYLHPLATSSRKAEAVPASPAPCRRPSPSPVPRGEEAGSQCLSGSAGRLGRCCVLPGPASPLLAAAALLHGPAGASCCVSRATQTAQQHASGH